MISPKVKAQPKPEKMGSGVIGNTDNNPAPAVNKIGRNRTTRLSRIASNRGRPHATDCCMKSTNMMKSLVTMPDKSIMPIMAVAVKKTESG